MKKSKITKIICCLFIMTVVAVACVTVIKNKDSNEPKHYIDPHELALSNYMIDPDADDDNDGLSNAEEDELGTNYCSMDTDKDSLSDSYEIKISKTDPLKKDTDGDGVDDGIEAELGLNPLQKHSDGETLDGDLKFSKTFEVEGCQLEVSGGADIYNIYVDTLDYCNLSNTSGVISGVYEFYMEDMAFDRAELTLAYSISKDDKYTKEENLKIYQLMNDTSFLEVGGTVDAENDTISVELEHFSKYFVGDSSIINQESDIQVFILLDNSGSMYPEELCNGSDENDVDFKRVDMAKKLVEMTGDNVKYGLAKFTGTYYELNDGFDNTKEDVLVSLENIKTESQVFDGTFIATSSVKALGNFDNNDRTSRKFVLLLTDGETTEGKGLFGFSWYDETDVIEEAQKKNVSFIVIGLGANVDEEYLKKIAEETNGLYVYANNDKALDMVYERLTSALNYNYTDLDGDGMYDHILVADSGFRPEKDGFSFKNYVMKSSYSDKLVNGQCYGLARFCQLYYKGKLLTKGEEVVRHWGGGPIYGAYLQCPAYDLSGISFFGGDSVFVSNKTNLYDYNSVLTTLTELYGDWVRSSEDSKHIVCSDEFYEYVKEYPNIIKITENEVPEKNRPVYASKDKLEYTKYETYYIDLSVDYEILNDAEKEIYDFCNTIHNFYVHQGADENEAEYIDNKKELSFNLKSDENFEEFISLLNDGIALILGGSGHAVNAIGLYRNIENPMEYTLLIYDNNSPSELTSVTLERVKTRVQLADMATHLTNDYVYYVYDLNNIFMSGKEELGNLYYAIAQEIYTEKEE